MTHYLSSWNGHVFSFTCHDRETLNLAHFLFQDFHRAGQGESVHHFSLRYDDKYASWSATGAEGDIYHGSSGYLLAYNLMNEVLFHCINREDGKHALHAGAVSRHNQCLLIPGVSGCGKSTLVTWLVSRGWNYISDELIFCSDSGEVTGIPRPISLKAGPGDPGWPEKTDETLCLFDDNGSMIPHRLLNTNCHVQRSQLHWILFPTFSPNTASSQEQLSASQCALRLMASNVNGRNFDGHGIDAMIALAKGCQAWGLSYSSFTQLEPLIQKLESCSQELCVS